MWKCELECWFLYLPLTIQEGNHIWSGGAAPVSRDNTCLSVGTAPVSQEDQHLSARRDSTCQPGGSEPVRQEGQSLSVRRVKTCQSEGAAPVSQRWQYLSVRRDSNYQSEEAEGEHLSVRRDSTCQSVGTAPVSQKGSTLPSYCDEGVARLSAPDLGCDSVDRQMSIPKTPGTLLSLTEGPSDTVALIRALWRVSRKSYFPGLWRGLACQTSLNMKELIQLGKSQLAKRPPLEKVRLAQEDLSTSIHAEEMEGQLSS